MVIQFSCPGCQQPIEVDDEWAGAQVACPFCQRVVTAPAASTLSSQQTTAPPEARIPIPSPAPPEAAAPAGFNRLAVGGLVCSMAAIFLLILGQLLLAFLMQEVDSSATMQEQHRQMLESIEQQDAMGRVLLGGGSMCLGLICWPVGLILSIIAVTRSYLRGRGLAIAGLVCSLFLPVMLCMGFLFGAV